MSKRLILSGNEAIARGAYEAGVIFAAGYPGTPSTEILENLCEYKDVKAEWSPNEKVALEVGMGAAFTGARVLVTMKHVGVNVAADPLMTLAYTGTKGGIVIISADDPAMHSSQNEQDNRFYARFAQIPMLEPSDSQEAYDMIKTAFDISEQFDTPVLFRVTTRVCHAQCIVEIGERVLLNRELQFDKNPQKYVMIPAYARKRHKFIKERTHRLEDYSNASNYQVEEDGEGEYGIITSGISYQYVKECNPNISVLKLGITNPLPQKAIEDFVADKKKVVVIEELEPFVEEQIRSWGLSVVGKAEEYKLGELSSEKVNRILHKELGEAIIYPAEKPQSEVKPGRPPVLCAGCAHRAVFTTLRNLKLTVAGDIGCYTLGCLPPLVSIDTCVCMGAGINHASGMSYVLDEKQRKNIVSVIGDSTFLHSGITGIVEMVYNKADATLILLDNRTTAMTGRQQHPGTGYTLQGEPTKSVDYAELCKALGVEFVKTANPYNTKEFEAAVKEAVEFNGPAVVISRADCILISKKRVGESFKIDTDKCKVCGLCLRVGCPAMKQTEKGIEIVAHLCPGCGLCYQICRRGAIEQMKDSE